MDLEELYSQLLESLAKDRKEKMKVNFSHAAMFFDVVGKIYQMAESKEVQPFITRICKNLVEVVENDFCKGEI